MGDKGRKKTGKEVVGVGGSRGEGMGGGAKEIELHLFNCGRVRVDAALQSKMLPCEGIREAARRPGLDLRTLWKACCNRSPFQVYACGSEHSLSIKPSLLQLTILNPGALKQKLLQRVGRSRPERGEVGWGLCGAIRRGGGWGVFTSAGGREASYFS